MFRRMTKRRKTPNRPRDVSQLAKRIVEISTGQAEDESPVPVSEEASKRGAARAASLSARRRREIAKKAAKARWKGKP